jgi:hypothetical protein
MGQFLFFTRSQQKRIGELVQQVRGRDALAFDYIIHISAADAAFFMQFFDPDALLFSDLFNKSIYLVQEKPSLLSVIILLYIMQVNIQSTNDDE